MHFVLVILLLLVILLPLVILLLLLILLLFGTSLRQLSSLISTNDGLLMAQYKTASRIIKLLFIHCQDQEQIFGTNIRHSQAANSSDSEN